MGPLEENVHDTKKAASIERVSVGKTESERLALWLAQLQAATGGFLNLSKTDLVNFLVRHHADELNSKEIQKLRQTHYDPLKHLNWITAELKSALLANDVQAVRRLQVELKNIELSVEATDAAIVESLGLAPAKPRLARKARTPKVAADTD